MSALGEILRGFRRNLLLIGGGWGIAEGCALAAGTSPVPGDLAGVAVGFAAAILAYPSVHEPLLRHVTRRPRRTMTPEDYRQLREMEIGLGWEPSEPPEGMTDPVRAPKKLVGSPLDAEAAIREHTARMRAAILAPGPDLGDVRGDLARDLRYLRDLERDTGADAAGAPMTGPGGRWRPLSELPEAEAEPGGIPAEPLIERMRRELEAPAPGNVTWDDVAYPSEASAHFAALARVGLEHCLSYCPICLHRLFGPMPDGVKPDASMRQWVEKNWGWRQ